MQQDLAIDVAIPTVGRIAPLRRCILSIFDQTFQPNSILIVDASYDSKVEQLIQELRHDPSNPGLDIERIIANERNVSKQKNQAIFELKKDVICFLDDDVILDSQYFQRISEVFERNPKISGVGGLIKSPEIDSLPKYLFKRLFLLNHARGKGTIQVSGFPTAPFQRKKQEVLEVEVLNGCACYKRSAIIEEDGFDEELGKTHVWEDVDLPQRISNNSKLIYTPKAKMFHEHAVGGRMDLEVYFSSYLYNHYYLFNKHIHSAPSSWSAFIWSHIGAVLYLFLWGIVKGNLRCAIRGLMKGNEWVLRSIFTDWKPQKGDT